MARVCSLFLALCSHCTRRLPLPSSCKSCAWCDECVTKWIGLVTIVVRRDCFINRSCIIIFLLLLLTWRLLYNAAKTPIYPLNCFPSTRFVSNTYPIFILDRYWTFFLIVFSQSVDYCISNKSRIVFKLKWCGWNIFKTSSALKIQC